MCDPDSSHPERNRNDRQILAGRLRQSDALARISDPRGFIAWKLSGLAMPMLALAHRLCDDIPADFHVKWEDGRQYGERVGAQRVMDMVRLGYEAGVDVGMRAGQAGVRRAPRPGLPRPVGRCAA
jgi:hypothetical protein